MKNLVDGVCRFQNTEYGARKELFEKLSQGQHPGALFITCSDSRIDPNLVTQSEPGDLFVLRNAGAIVPPHGADAGAEAGAIEYAVSALGVRDVIICGHSQCGAMGGLLNPASVEKLPAVKTWLKHAEATSRIISENHADVVDPAARLAAAIEANVLVQLENLRTHPSVAAAIERGELALHGWVYKFETGDVFAYNAEQRQFSPLAEAA